MSDDLSFDDVSEILEDKERKTEKDGESDEGSSKEGYRDIDYFLEFKEGFGEALKTHLFSVDQIRKELFNSPLGDDHIKEIDNRLSSIIDITDKAILSLKEDELDSISRKEYRNFFSSDYEIELNKVKFLILKNLYEMGKRLSKEICDEWKVIDSVLKEAKGKGGDVPESISRQVEARLLFCEKTFKFLDFVKEFLNVKKEIKEEYSGNIVIYPEYSPRREYSYFRVFDYIRGFEDEASYYQESSDLKEADSSVGRREKEDIFKGDLLKKKRKVFVLKQLGNKEWNTGREFELIIDVSKLEADEEKIKRSILILEENLPQEEINKRIRRVLLVVKSIEDIKNIGRYKGFLKIVILNEYSTIRDFFGISDEDMPLFLYFVGAYTFFVMVKEYLFRSNIGYVLYIPSSQKIYGGKVVKYLPLEFVKNEIRIFWEDELYYVLDKDKINNKIEYQRFTSIVKMVYEKDKSMIREKIEFIKNKLGIVEKSFISKEIDSLIPMEKVLVYRRFGFI